MIQRVAIEQTLGPEAWKPGGPQSDRLRSIRLLRLTRRPWCSIALSISVRKSRLQDRESSNILELVERTGIWSVTTVRAGRHVSLLSLPTKATQAVRTAIPVSQINHRCPRHAGPPPPKIAAPRRGVQVRFMRD